MSAHSPWEVHAQFEAAFNAGDIEGLLALYEPNAILIVGAEGERPVRRHLRRYPYDLPIYLEVDRIPPAFGLRGLPTSWLVDREGRIVLLRHGEAVWDTDEVEAFVREITLR